MMPRPSLSLLSIGAYDEAKDVYSAPLRTVLTPQGCAITHTVVPAQDYNELAAKELRAQLLILAFSTLK